MFDEMLIVATVIVLARSFIFQTHTLKHFLARAICLIAVPVATYLLVYCIHDSLILQV